MSPGLIVLIVIVVVVLVGTVLAYYASVQRRKELTAWAQSHGMSFTPDRDCGFDDLFSNFKCLRQGESRYAHNIMEGEWNDLAIKAFDYHYSTGSGKRRHDHHFSAVILASGVPLKPLHIRREKFIDKLTAFFGVDDINFESAEFSRKFYVKSPDKQWAYDVIHARMMEYLMDAPNFRIQFDSMHIIAWQEWKFKPADFQAAAELISGILDRLPEYLLKKQIEGP